MISLSNLPNSIPYSTIGFIIATKSPYLNYLITLEKVGVAKISYFLVRRASLKDSLVKSSLTLHSKLEQNCSNSVRRQRTVCFGSPKKRRIGLEDIDFWRWGRPEICMALSKSWKFFRKCGEGGARGERQISVSVPVDQRH